MNADMRERIEELIATGPARYARRGLAVPTLAYPQWLGSHILALFATERAARDATIVELSGEVAELKEENARLKAQTGEDTARLIAGTSAMNRAGESIDTLRAQLATAERERDWARSVVVSAADLSDSLWSGGRSKLRDLPNAENLAIALRVALERYNKNLTPTKAPSDPGRDREAEPGESALLTLIADLKHLASGQAGYAPGEWGRLREYVRRLKAPSDG